MVKIFVFLLIFLAQMLAKPIDFSLYKLESSANSPTLLIISGIQGDEPGAFNATSLLIKHYKIARGSLWVVPNLNQHSILKNTRGVYGDMNRKFAALSASDPEFEIIQNIKRVILDSRVDKILHLHDGSGFYREKYISHLLNENRWGNCSIIDTDSLFSRGDLRENISSVINHINENLLDEMHRFRVRNTEGDIEQQKSLTFFATQNQKMAFASEASKSLPLAKRVYYHLLAIEGMMQNMGIEFSRDFKLETGEIEALINDKNAVLRIAEIISLPIFNLKPQLNFFPIDKNRLDFSSDTPIVWFFKDGAKFRIKHGNRGVAALNPFFVEYDFSLENVVLEIDGKLVQAKMGEILRVKNAFKVAPGEFRVNVIGFQSSANEAGIKISRKDLLNRFAIDKANTKFRVEFYVRDSADSRDSLDSKRDSKREKFAGMVIVDFGD